MELEELQKYDLTNVVSRHLDLHMVHPLLEFLSQKDLYPEEDLLVAKLKFANKTNMVDFAINLHQQLHQTEEVPEELAQRRQAVIDRLQVLMEESKLILDLFRKPEVLSQLRSDKQFNIQFLKENHGFQLEHLESLYKYAKFQFECGEYAGASEMLYQFRVLSTDAEKNLSALWGKLASEILLGNWDTITEDFTHMKSNFEQTGYLPSLELLQHRTWLIHWGLFLLSSPKNGRDVLLDMLLQPAYRQTIQTTCPHILRYLTVLVILKKRNKDSLREVLAMIQQESYQYRDPLTELMEALFINYDFDGAQQLLLRCEKVMQYDFFLEDLVQEFSMNARLFIFETYCKIHQRIDLESLGQKLGMERDEAEKWIVNLIRSAQLDAKIDSEKNAVTLSQKSQNIYQQVIERTKPLTFRTNVLSISIDKKNSQPTQSTRGGQRNFQQRGGKRGGGGGGGGGHQQRRPQQQHQHQQQHHQQQEQQA